MTDPTLGQRAAEWMARAIGWKFVIAQTLVILLWIVCNVAWLSHADRWDPYPFILLNLGLSLQAAYTGPILLIAAQRQERKAQEMAQETHDLIREVHDWLHAAHFDQATTLAEIEKTLRANS